MFDLKCLKAFRTNCDPWLQGVLAEICSDQSNFAKLAKKAAVFASNSMRTALDAIRVAIRENIAQFKITAIADYGMFVPIILNNYLLFTDQTAIFGQNKPIIEYAHGQLFGTAENG